MRHNEDTKSKARFVFFEVLCIMLESVKVVSTCIGLTIYVCIYYTCFGTDTCLMRWKLQNSKRQRSTSRFSVGILIMIMSPDNSCLVGSRNRSNTDSEFFLFARKNFSRERLSSGNDATVALMRHE